MKVAIIGYGRMGKAVERACKDNGHEVCAVIDQPSHWKESLASLKKAHVAIEFTLPKEAPGNIRRCHELGIPVVSGTTGWDQEREELAKEVEKEQHTLFYAPNFSIGVNLFFQLNRLFSKIMSPHEQYHPSIMETHHKHKQDAPSGTAIQLANQIIQLHQQYHQWSMDHTPPAGNIPVTALREEEVIGEHTITWDSPLDTIQMTHQAKDRSGFAKGAVTAAQWVMGKKGYYQMENMLFPNS